MVATSNKRWKINYVLFCVIFRAWLNFIFGIVFFWLLLLSRYQRVVLLLPWSFQMGARDSLTIILYEATFLFLGINHCLSSSLLCLGWQTRCKLSPGKWRQFPFLSPSLSFYFFPSFVTIDFLFLSHSLLSTLRQKVYLHVVIASWIRNSAWYPIRYLYRKYFHLDIHLSSFDFAKLCYLYFASFFLLKHKSHRADKWGH